MNSAIDTLTASVSSHSSQVDRVERFWQFLQGNFLLLFPISLFFLLGLFAIIIAASP
jgi:hypothetical protein